MLYTRPFYRFPSLNSIKLGLGLKAFSFLCSNVLLRLCFTFSFSGIKQKHFHVKSLTLQNKSSQHFPERCIKCEGANGRKRGSKTKIREKAKKRVMLNGHHTLLFANLKVLKA